MTTQQTTVDDDPTDFAAWLVQQAHGETNDVLSGALRDLVGACSSTGKKGTLTLTVQVDPVKDGPALVITDKVKVNLPDPDREPVVWYAGDKGRLVRNDPRQDVLFGAPKSA